MNTHPKVFPSGFEGGGWLWPQNTTKGGHQSSEQIELSLKRWKDESVNPTWHHWRWRENSIPMNPPIPLSQTTGSLLENPTSYRALIGRLLYRKIIYYDITFNVNRLSQFLWAPIDVQMQAAHKILRYFKANPGQGLFYAVFMSSVWML